MRTRCRFFLVLVGSSFLFKTYCQSTQVDQNAIGTTQTFDPSVDFEDETFSDSWIDKSPTDVQWRIEDYTSIWETDCPAPIPRSGQRYLRVDRGSSISFGVAVLRSLNLDWLPHDRQPTFISFSFWIRSKWPQFNNLELYLSENGRESLLASLWQYSNISNKEWQTLFIPFSPTQSSDRDGEIARFLVFYAYCGTNVEDAIAIDNIFLILPSSSTTTNGPEPENPIKNSKTLDNSPES